MTLGSTKVWRCWTASLKQLEWTYSAYTHLDLSLSLFLLTFSLFLLSLSLTHSSSSHKDCHLTLSCLTNNNIYNMNGSPIPSATSMSPTQNGSNIMSVDGKRILCTADVRGKITLLYHSVDMFLNFWNMGDTLPWALSKCRYSVYSLDLSLFFRQHLASEPTRTRHQRRLHYTHWWLWLLW